MDSQGTAGAEPNWYADPSRRHQYRWWDGSTWTDTVADQGRQSLDPLQVAPPETDQATRTGRGETVLLTLERATSVTMGGSMNIYLTDRRIVVEPVLGTGASVASVAAGGLAGNRMARKAAERHRLAQGPAERPTMDAILRSSAGAYAIDYRDVNRVVLKRRALPLGYSRLQVESRQKKVTLAFKRDDFAHVSEVLTGRLAGKVANA